MAETNLFGTGCAAWFGATSCTGVLELRDDLLLYFYDPRTAYSLIVDLSSEFKRDVREQRE